MSQLNLYHTEPTTKKWKNGKTTTDMLRSISKQSRESVESVTKKKRNGWDLQKRKVLSLQNERVRD